MLPVLYILCASFPPFSSLMHAMDPLEPALFSLSLYQWKEIYMVPNLELLSSISGDLNHIWGGGG